MRNISTAIVTGGAGFIGSHIVDQLLKKNIETFVLDNFSTGSMENLVQNKNNKLLHIISGDIKNVSNLLSDVNSADVLFHEAAIASVPRSVEDPIFVHNVNVNSTLEVLDYCLKKKVKRFIFASSAAVYGKIKEPPAMENLPCAPSSPYGASKMAVEDYLNAYHNTYGLDTVILRYFNVFGPRQKTNSYSGVITVFINNLLQGRNPTIFGDGGQTRDFVHVRDIAQANMISMESDQAVGEVFNVASGSAVSILGLFELIKDATGAKDALPQFADPAMGDVRIGAASIDKIKKSMGYNPRVRLDEGLAELVDETAKKTVNVVYNG